MRYLVKVFIVWGGILFPLLVLVFYLPSNHLILGLFIGSVVSFVPHFILRTLDEKRKWDIENIERIYAPLSNEIDNLVIYFSEARKGDYKGELFGYGNDRGKLLSMDSWRQVAQKDHLYYRIKIDDEELARDLHMLYFILPFYIQGRTEFLKTTLDPVFLPMARDLDVHTREKLRKIQIEVTNILLDALSPNQDPRLGLIQLTEMPLDYEEVRKKANTAEKSPYDFVARIFETIQGRHYKLLLEQRGKLLEEALKCRAKLKKKLEKSKPI